MRGVDTPMHTMVLNTPSVKFPEETAYETFSFQLSSLKFHQSTAEAYLGTCQTSVMELFCTNSSQLKAIDYTV